MNREKLNIAMVCRNCITVPPKGYGGTERVLYDLTEELVKMGHNVYLFAKKGSRTSANLIEYPSYVTDGDICKFVLENLPEDVDIIHDNSEYITSEAKFNPGKIKQPIAFTIHYASRQEYDYENIIYPSYFTKNLLTGGDKSLNNVVHHGININDYIFKEEKEDYLLCMGILKYPKGTHQAIELAERLNMRLIIAGPQDDDDVDKNYFTNYIQPHLSERIQYVGVATGDYRLKLLSEAKALIFPTQIETFGLVSIEAMASGTPCLFLNTCTGKEILQNKFSNCLCSNIEEMENLIKNNNLPKSKDLREFVKENYSSEVMARNYLARYYDLLEMGKYEMEEKRPINSISLCLIAKNEEKNLDNCLKSVYDIVDEIIVVDTGSTDRTKEIAKKYTDKVYDFEWIYDFSAARNYSISFATCEYILFLDCDDIFKEEDRQKLKKLKSEIDGSIDMYWLYYDYRHDENGVSNYSFLSERIFRNNRGAKWECVIHEVLKLGDMYYNSVKTDIRITHTSNHDNTDKYLAFFQLQEDRGHVFNQREKYFYTMELLKHGFDDKAYDLLIDLTKDFGSCNTYEKSSIYGMAADISKKRGNFNEAINQYLMASGYHQPLPYYYYSIAESYRALRLFDHAKFYYKILASGENFFFKEKFLNESVYTNFEWDVRTYKINSLLSLIMIYYHDFNDVASSEYYNDKLLEVDPNNEYGNYNKQFFDSLKNKE